MAHVTIRLKESEKRFGFSVIGGLDEGVTAAVEDIIPGAVLIVFLFVLLSQVRFLHISPHQQHIG